jgi:hypothetical protein
MYFSRPTIPAAPIAPELTATWPIGDPVERALWLGALAAVSGRHRASLHGDLADLVATGLACWPARARA